MLYLSLLIADSGTLSTSLKILNNHKFEAFNIKNKALLYITDSYMYQGDIGVLKTITGGDKLQGRIQFKIQNSSKVIMIFIV